VRRLLQFDRAFAASLVRVLRVGCVALALALGAVAGLVLRGLPGGELAAEVLPALVATLAGALVLPLAAGVLTSERHGGFEQLVAVRPIGSLAWTLGRTSGSLVGAAVLVLLLAAAARLVGGTVSVPETVEGTNVHATPSMAVWRFPLPAGRAGLFELRLAGAGPRVLSHALGVEVGRGTARSEPTTVQVSGRTIRLDVPDLAPARGDLFVTLRPAPGLVLGAAPPRLAIGTRPLGRDGSPLSADALRRLGLAVRAALAAACAFRFETACLAGLLALVVDVPWEGPRLPLAVAGLLLVAVLGTALTRRAALP
jgi:hypothetical protein